MILQNKSEKYWEKTIDAERRRISYFDSYFENESRKKSLDFRVNLLLNQQSAVGSFLDVGCGYGAFLYEIFSQNNNFDLAGLDISKDAIDFCTEKVPTARLVNDTINNLNEHFEENSYDVVFTSGVMIHQAPETLSSLIDNLIKIGRKYIIHFEDEGVGELISGEKEFNPSWRESGQFLWKNGLTNIYQNKGCSFYFGTGVPAELQQIGFTNYIVVDLLNSNTYYNQSDEDRAGILNTEEKIMKNLIK